MHTLIGQRVVMLRPQEIRSTGFAARRFFDPYELQRLADSIAASGIIEPLIVRKNGGNFELIAGERRLRAARMAKLRRVPCVIHKADDRTSGLYTLLDNLQRQPLDLFEEAEALHELYRQFDLSQTEIGLRLGLTGSQLADKFRLLQLSPFLQERIRKENLCEAQVQKLIRLPAAERMETIDRMVGKSLPQPVQVEKKEPEKNADVPEKPIRKSAIGDPQIFANSLYKLVDTTQNAGINIQVRKNENEKYVEYRVKIHKESLKNGCHQLKIC
ncbi:MAG: ParB/RepB/Spo0J family partition protein [Clostridia bacterium]|nr:ParB/RepB/Spo0J family partition protein [Clostridia bacterium]